MEKNTANSENCTKIPRGVNFTMYLDNGLDGLDVEVGELRTRLRDYSWENTTTVTFEFPTNLTGEDESTTLPR